VPFADQYGSQTEKVTNGDFASDTAWTKQTGWTIGSGVASSTGSNNGAYLYQGVGGLTGKRYRISVEITVATSGSITPLSSSWSASNLSTVGVHTFDQIWLGTDPTLHFRSNSFNGSLDNVSVVEIGCVSDYDCAFSNPEISFMVQDRSTNGVDGEASNDGTNPTGISQVTPIVQVNATAARIGTSAATPADGEVIANSLTVGNVGTQATISAPGTLTIAANSGAGALIVSNADGSADIVNVESGKFVIDSAGNVGVGGTPVGNLDVFDSVSTAYATPGTGRTPVGALIRINNTDATAGNYVGLDLTTHGSTLALGQHAYIGAVGNASGYAPDIVIGQSTAGSVTTERIRIDSAGNVAINNDTASAKLDIRTDGSGTALRLENTSGGYFTVADGGATTVGGLATFSNGIAFQSATTGSGTGTGYTLDSYETGTFTPTFSPETNSFTSITYDSTGGRYTKIGNLVHIQIFIRTASLDVGTATGNLHISGLPFTATASTGGTSDGYSPFSFSEQESWGGDFPNSGEVDDSATQIRLRYQTASNVASSRLQVSDMATHATSVKNRIRIAGTYIAA
jgi:hypothetical protein